jgi:hypothetical protein
MSSGAGASKARNSDNSRCSIARETNLEACVATARNHVDECSAV